LSNIYDTYETVVGLEIHLQLNTKSKAYCNDVNQYGALPNSNIGVVTLGHPGTLPVSNKEVIKSACKLGLALGCDIRRDMFYARKNYFYPDLPKGYQITQDNTPICNGGKMVYDMPDGSTKTINLTRIHMEEDAGKSMHDQDPYNTLVDLNRAGVPLLEIVSEPELRSGEEAYHYVSEVRKIVRHLDICDGNLEEGSLRCDANISVRKKGSEELGTRTEIKNLNSFRNVQRAIEHEAIRQVDLIEKGKVVAQETRGFDAIEGTTYSQRSKEQAHDYRYFPEPDLAPISLSEDYLNKIQSELPELPRAMKDRFVAAYGLSQYDANILAENKDLAEYYSQVLKFTKHFKSAANWMLGSVKSHLNELGLHITEFPISPERIAELVNLIADGTVNNSIAAQKLFPAMLTSNATAKAIATDLNLIQDVGSDEIETIAKEALAKYPEKVAAYKAGNKNLLGLFMGEFMKMAKGKANPKEANTILQKLLND
jgi:aspartyl-tRNA(Asn)/glutamyl-tRNA(Gln) amidotransferase subunit B